MTVSRWLPKPAILRLFGLPPRRRLVTFGGAGGVFSEWEYGSAPEGSPGRPGWN